MKSEIGELLKRAMKFKAAFVYPSEVEEGVIYAEDIEEAIIQYLVNAGFDEDKLRTSRFEFEDPSTGRGITTKVLKIKIY